jgi:hypothetical protein
MNVGDPNCLEKDQSSRRESDMPIVVKIAEKVKAAGAKGHYCNQIFPEQSTDRIDVKKSAERRISK